MNFEDLLDEDGQGTRELDKWLHQNIALKMIEDYSIIPFYTTGDWIDSIYSLADDYFNIWTLRSHGKYEYSVETPNQCDYNEFMTPQLAIAEALFKAYQEKEVENE